MNDELRLIRHLYGEAEAPESLEHDAALREEYDQARRVRDALDARPAARPSDGVLDRVMLAAANGGNQGAGTPHAAAGEEEPRPHGVASGEAQAASPRRDRPAVPPRSQRWTRLLNVGGALAVVLLLVVVGREHVAPEPMPQQPEAQEQAVQERAVPGPAAEVAPGEATPATAAREAEPQEASAPPTEAGTEPAAARTGAVLADASGPEDEDSASRGGEVPEELLAWDAPQAEVFEAYRRVQALQARSSPEGLRPSTTRRALYD